MPLTFDLGAVLAVVLAAIAGIAWLVRLEGRVTSVAARASALEEAAKAHAETKIEVVRLQEQIKHLTELIERWLGPPDRQNPRAARRPAE